MANFGACRCWCADRKSHRRGNEGQPERSMGVPWVQEDPEYLRIGEGGAILPAQLLSPNRQAQSRECGGLHRVSDGTYMFTY